MNIKYITDVRLPTSRAVGFAVMKMCEEFSSQGASLKLIIPDKSDSDSLGDPFEYYKIKKNFEIRKIPSTDFLGSSIKKNSLFYFLDLISFIFSVRFNSGIERGDVLYTRDYLIPLFFPKRNTVCLEVHDIPKSTTLLKLSCKKSDLIFVLTRYIKDLLIKLGVDGNKIQVIPSGVDVGYFDIDLSKIDARKRLNLPQDEHLIVYTGHLYDWKGVHTLADTAKILKDKTFIFIGGVVPELNQFTDKYRPYENIKVIPHLERFEVPIYLKSADVLAIPNSGKFKISREYTSPLKLFEYMSSRRPIVASDLPSMREVLNESNSFFATPDDPESFAKVISNILENKTLSESVSTKARDDVEQYSWANRTRKIISFIGQNK